MAWLLLLNAAILLAIAGIAALLKWYLPSYLAEKGKNLATKEDVGRRGAKTNISGVGLKRQPRNEHCPRKDRGLQLVELRVWNIWNL